MSSQAPSDSSPTPELIFDTLVAYQRTEALRAGIELDLFRAIGEGPGDVASIAKRCKASERGIRILCDYLTIGGFLVKSDGRYSNSEVSAKFLDPRSPTSIAATAGFMGNPMLREPFMQLAKIVRAGRTTLPGQGSVEPDNPAWVDFAHSMAPRMAPVAAQLAPIVLAGKRGSISVLDVAAGHGLFGIEVAKQNRAAHITAIDWAAVLEVARANARQAGVEDRYVTRPGSAFDVEFGGPHDVVLLTNFLHHFDTKTCTALLKKARAALKRDGIVAALEFVPNDDRVSPPMPAGFSLTMLATTEAGDAYTLREYEAIYRAAGFTGVQGHALTAGPHTVVVGRAA
ncbi:MAG TPA: class I SAM-dependent methyltransferase [Patescibacteria group bacterium]|nr:class I SAM-dependent methyltransferase [Patescibacteria group bacterium]